MSNYDSAFGHRFNWTNGAARALRQEDCKPVDHNSEAIRGDDKDCCSPKSVERAIIQSSIVQKLRNKVRTAELVAMLPQCESPSRSIDEICAETLALIDLLDSDSEL